VRRSAPSTPSFFVSVPSFMPVSLRAPRGSRC
jgi:hypothetical protein